MYANIFGWMRAKTVRSEMTFPYGRMPWFAVSTPPFVAVAEHDVVVARVGLRRQGRPIVAVVTRVIGSRCRRCVARLTNAAGGRAADACGFLRADARLNEPRKATASCAEGAKE